MKASSENGRWVGQTIIFKPDDDRNQIFRPVVLASLTAEDSSGNMLSTDLKWKNILPENTTKLKQYFFIKQHQSPLVKPLFDVTSIFYQVILIIASIALVLNIFIEIKKQYPHIIFSTLGLISLLIALVIF